MDSISHANIIRIGNSKGIRIPKRYLEKLGEKVIIEQTQGGLFIRPDIASPVPPREKWDILFSKAKAEEPEKDIFEGMTNDVDFNEWEW